MNQEYNIFENEQEPSQDDDEEQQQSSDSMKEVQQKIERQITKKMTKNVYFQFFISYSYQKVVQFRKQAVLLNKDRPTTISELELQQQITQNYVSSRYLVWKQNPFRVVLNVCKFIKQIKQKSLIQRFKLLTQKDFENINDPTSEYLYFIQNQLINQTPSMVSISSDSNFDQVEKFLIKISYGTNWIEKFMYTVYQFIHGTNLTIHPGNNFLYFWDIFLSLLTILNILYIPLEPAFNIEKHDYFITSFLFGTLPSYIFTIDILIQFNKGYYKKGVLIIQQKEIFWHYIKGNLAWDLLIVVPFYIQRLGVQLTNFLMLLRLTRVRKQLRNIESISNFKEKGAALFELFCLVYYVILISHFCACMWSYLAKMEMYYGYEHTWMHEYGIEHADWGRKYIFSIYWIAITSMTVGYGDIVPQTDPEKVFVTLITFIVSGLFAYAVNAIGNIFQKMSDKEEVYKTKIRIINQYIRERKLSKELQLKVKKYYEYYFQFKQEEEQEVQEIIQLMNSDLKREVLQDMYKKVLKQSKFLTHQFTDAFIQKLCLLIKEKTYAPDQLILQEGDPVNHLMFLMQGKVATYAVKKKHLRIYQAQNVIAETQFFLNSAMQYNVKAGNFVQIAYINRDDFMQLLKQFPEDHYKFCHFRDNQILNQNVESIIRCEACKNQHFFKHCPFVFFQANKNRCIKQRLATDFEKKRRKFPRANQTKFNMEKRDKILEGALKLMIKNCLRHTSTIELNRETLLEYGFKKKTVEKLLAQTSSPTLDTDQVFTFDQDEVIMSEFKHDLNESKFSEDLLNRQQINCEIDKVLFNRNFQHFYFPEDSVDQILRQVNYQASMKDLIHRMQQRAKYKRSFTSRYIMLQLLNFKKQN